MTGRRTEDRTGNRTDGSAYVGKKIFLQWTKNTAGYRTKDGSGSKTRQQDKIWIRQDQAAGQKIDQTAGQKINKVV
jgi:hypothetical protein